MDYKVVMFNSLMFMEQIGLSRSTVNHYADSLRTENKLFLQAVSAVYNLHIKINCNFNNCKY